MSDVLPTPAIEQPHFRAWRWMAVIAGLFCALVLSRMVLQSTRALAADPLNPAELLAAREELSRNPTDEALKARIRELDLRLRRRYFRQVSLKNTGGFLLAAGAIVFLIAAKQAGRFLEQPPMPGPDPHATERFLREVRLGRYAVGVTGAVVLSAAVLTFASGPAPLPARVEAWLQPKTNAVAGAMPTPLPSPNEIARNWPRFHGPAGNGRALGTNFPTRWNVDTGEGIVWKTAVPLPGFNSPVVWNDKIFLAGADPTHCEIYCFGAETGQLNWRRSLDRLPPAAKVGEDTGYAASTLATDGLRVFGIFANGELAALDFSGTVIWRKSLGLPANPYGHATSLVIWEDRLLVQFDQGQAEAGRSALYAFDGATGRIVWQTKRQVPSSWATPIVIESAGRPQIVTLGEPSVISYDLKTGGELWRVKCLGSDLAPSPVFAGGLVMVPSPWQQTTAIRPDGSGDVTESQVAWTAREGIPDITSPASDGQRLYTISSDGMLNCFKVTDGSLAWDHSLDFVFHASPILAGDRIYLFSTEGVAIVASVGASFQEIARSELKEDVHATAAFVGDRIYVRGAAHLFCIGAGRLVSNPNGVASRPGERAATPLGSTRGNAPTPVLAPPNSPSPKPWTRST